MRTSPESASSLCHNKVVGGLGNLFILINLRVFFGRENLAERILSVLP
ncbi:MAG: hypothetical protein LBJ00_02330 [Planctomycetaceae bacterium]|nr:hypothetical protein [Planctomycetaceae bacterium]